MKLEIERKFLLKSVPDINPSEIIKIEQFYYKNSSGIWERARSWDSDVNDTKYIHTVKKSVSKGVNLEDEYFMTKDEFNKFKKHCLTVAEYRHISKERWIYPDGNLYWEVDVFNSGYNLIIAEIEIPIKSYKLNIPDFIKEKMLLEVTEMKQFSNRSLSKKIYNNI
jgi:CYTH domain-containing protein